MRKNMRKNVGTLDKSLRVIVALLIGVLLFFKVVSGPIAILLGVVAVMLVITSLASFCPLYAMFKVNTCLHKQKE